VNNSNNITVVAYAVYPEIKSSEGIVNANWIAILEQRGVTVQLFSVFSGYDGAQNNRNELLVKQYNAAKKKKTLNGLLYKVKNKLHANEYDVPLHIAEWKNTQLPFFKKIARSNPSVVWARVLPLEGLSLPLEASKDIDFPLVININDPVVETNSYPFFSTLISKTQCWTFPSNAMAQEASELYHLPIERCFVLPHAMQSQKKKYEGPTASTSFLNILYTGTFYKSAFTKELQHGLVDFCASETAQKVSFTFILGQYDAESIRWLEETIPNVKILKNLDRSEVLEITKTADLVLVVDAATHTTLLKGKLAEAISFGVPILGISYKNAVMDKVLQRYGTACAYQDQKGDVFDKLTAQVNNLSQETWLNTFKENREEVIARFSEERLFQDTLLINKYASALHLAKQNNTALPEAPEVLQWP